MDLLDPILDDDFFQTQFETDMGISNGLQSMRKNLSNEREQRRMMNR